MRAAGSAAFWAQRCGPGVALWAWLDTVGTCPRRDEKNLAPNTPDNIIQAYIAASKQMVQDPDFKKLASTLTESPFQVGTAVDQAFKKLMAVKPTDE